MPAIAHRAGLRLEVEVSDVLAIADRGDLSHLDVALAAHFDLYQAVRYPRQDVAAAEAAADPSGVALSLADPIGDVPAASATPTLGKAQSGRPSSHG